VASIPLNWISGRLAPFKIKMLYSKAMKNNKTPSYKAAVLRIQNAADQSKDSTLARLGEIHSGPNDYPVYSLRIASQGRRKRSKRRVCLSAGIHGDEPAGVEALLTFIESPLLYKDFLRAIDFTVFPCINPYGYEHQTRTNGQRFDLNRKFDRKRPPKEVSLIRGILERQKFDLSIEFHEDVDTEGFYLYELKKKQPYFGEAIIRNVAGRCRINHNHEIEGLPSSGGIIRPPIERILAFRKKDWPQAVYLFKNGTLHCITFETPITLPLKERASIHLIALDTALRHLIQI
jgi:murein peptide amidase A